MSWTLISDAFIVALWMNNFRIYSKSLSSYMATITAICFVDSAINIIVDLFPFNELRMMVDVTILFLTGKMLWDYFRRNRQKKPKKLSVRVKDLGHRLVLVPVKESS